MNERKYYVSVVLITACLVITATLVVLMTRLRAENDQPEGQLARIVVDQYYGNAEGVNLAFEDMARGLLEYAGRKTLEKGAVLKIKVEGKAEAAYYSKAANPIQFAGDSYSLKPDYRYSGASLSGTISLELPESAVYRKTFKGYVKPPRSIGEDEFETVSSAPFKEAFHASSFQAKLLEMMGEIYGVNTLFAALKDKSAWARASAAWALGELKDSAAIESLTDALKDEDPDVRMNAAWALGEIKDGLALEALIAALMDRDRRVIYHVSWALGELKDSRSVEHLVAVLTRDEATLSQQPGQPLFVMGTISATKTIEDKNELKPRIAILKEENSDFRKAAAQALQKITNQSYGTDPESWSEYLRKTQKR